MLRKAELLKLMYLEAVTDHISMDFFLQHNLNTAVKSISRTTAGHSYLTIILCHLTSIIILQSEVNACPLCRQQRDFADFLDSDNISNGHRDSLKTTLARFAADHSKSQEECKTLLQLLQSNARAVTVFLKEENCEGFLKRLKEPHKQKVLAQLQVNFPSSACACRM